MEAGVVPQVLVGGNHKSRALEVPEPEVAVAAQQAPHRTSGVVVVHARLFHGLPTDCTATSVVDQQVVELVGCQPVLAPNVAGSFARSRLCAFSHSVVSRSLALSLWIVVIATMVTGLVSLGMAGDVGPRSGSPLVPILCAPFALVVGVTLAPLSRNGIGALGVSLSPSAVRFQSPQSFLLSFFFGRHTIKSSE